jgi:hypothetical protein
LPDLIFDTEDGGDAFLRNVGGRLQNWTGVTTQQIVL